MSSLSSPQGRDDNIKLSGHILKSDQSIERMFILKYSYFPGGILVKIGTIPGHCSRFT